MAQTAAHEAGKTQLRKWLADKRYGGSHVDVNASKSGPELCYTTWQLDKITQQSLDKNCVT